MPVYIAMCIYIIKIDYACMLQLIGSKVMAAKSPDNSIIVNHPLTEKEVK